MITRVLSVGLLAGLLAGLAVAALQAFTTTPLILEAEVFEAARLRRRPAHRRGCNGAVSQHRRGCARDPRARGRASRRQTAAEEWAPGDGVERTLLHQHRHHRDVDRLRPPAHRRHARLAATPSTSARRWPGRRRALPRPGLAPALGLSPELPGMPASDLAGRQEWWLITAAVTAGALWLFLRCRPARAARCSPFPSLSPRTCGARRYHVARGGQEQRAARARGALRGHVACRAGHPVGATGFFVGLLWPAAHRRASRRRLAARWVTARCPQRT